MPDVRYLAVFTSDKAGPKWAAWRAMTKEEQDETAARGVAAVKAWEAAHSDHILYVGGPLGPTKRLSDAGAVTDIVNLLTVFMVVRVDPFRVGRHGRSSRYGNAADTGLTWQ